MSGFRVIGAVVGTAVICATAGAGKPAAGQPGAPANGHRELVDRYCVACHNDRLEDRRAVARRDGPVGRRRRGGGLGEGGREAARRGDAAAAAAAARAGCLRRLPHLARDPARPRRRRRSAAGADRGAAPAEPRRVPQRRPRPPRPRCRRERPAAGRRYELRLRQHRGRARGLADPHGAVPGGGAEDRPARGGVAGAVADRRDVPRPLRPGAGRPRRGAPVRHPRGHGRRLQLPRGRRVRDLGRPRRPPLHRAPRARADPRRRAPRGVHGRPRPRAGAAPQPVRGGGRARGPRAGQRRPPPRRGRLPAQDAGRGRRRTRKLYKRPFTGEGSGADSRYQPYLERLTIAGPFESRGTRPLVDTPSRARIFTCEPGSDAASAAACAADILSGLARRAFRRPVTGEDVDRLLDFYERGAATNGFDGGIELALRRLLVSPEFLFRIVEDPAGLPPGAVYEISDLELASRLSFFLWSSIPDDELLDAADRAASCGDPAGLEAQTRRMLADPRAAGPRHQLRGAVAQPAQRRRGAARRGPLPRLRGGPAAGLPARDGDALRRHPARGPQRRRAALGRLHVPERTARGALRHPERAGQPLPAGHARRSGAGRAARPRQHPDRDLARQPHVAGGAGQVGAREHPRHAAPAAPRGRPGPGGHHRRPHPDHARGDGAAPGQPRVRELPPGDGPPGPRPRAVRRHRPPAHAERDPGSRWT